MSATPVEDLSNVCFLVCSVKHSDSQERKNADRLEIDIVRPVLEELGFGVVRIDLEDKPGSMLVNIVDYLRDAFVVIVDLTYENVNVGYEMAIRHAARRHCITMSNTEVGARAGSDVKHHQYIPYTSSFQDIMGTHGARERLKRRVQSLGTDGSDLRNPLAEALIVLDSPAPEAMRAVVEELASIRGIIERLGGTHDLSASDLVDPIEQPTPPDRAKENESILEEVSSPSTAKEQVMASTESESSDAPPLRPTGIPKRLSEDPGSVGFYTDPFDLAQEYVRTFSEYLTGPAENRLLSDPNFVTEAARAVMTGSIGPAWRIADAINSDLMNPVRFPVDQIVDLQQLAQAFPPDEAFAQIASDAFAHASNPVLDAAKKVSEQWTANIAAPFLANFPSPFPATRPSRRKDE